MNFIIITLSLLFSHSVSTDIGCPAIFPPYSIQVNSTQEESVWHPIHIEKSRGINETPLSVIDSYSNSSRQIPSRNDTFSEYSPYFGHLFLALPALVILFELFREEEEKTFESLSKTLKQESFFDDEDESKERFDFLLKKLSTRPKAKQALLLFIAYQEEHFLTSEELCELIDWFLVSPSGLYLLEKNIHDENLRFSLLLDSIKSRIKKHIFFTREEQEAIQEGLSLVFNQNKAWDRDTVPQLVQRLSHEKDVLFTREILARLEQRSFSKETLEMAFYVDEQVHTYKKNLHTFIKVLSNLYFIEKIESKITPQQKKAIYLVLAKFSSLDAQLYFFDLSLQEDKVETVANALFLLYQYDLPSNEYPKILEQLQRTPLGQWDKMLHEHLIAYTFLPVKQFTTPQIVEKIKASAEENGFAHLQNSFSLQEAYETIQQCYGAKSSMRIVNRVISDWTKRDVQKWARKRKKKNSSCDLYESLAVIQHAVKLQEGFMPRSVQMLSILCFLNATQKKGLLQEINTGQGKSTIIAMLAALLALQEGRTVDILTSSEELTKREVKEKKAFFELLGLSVAHNHIPPNACGFDRKKRKVYEQNDIVYSANYEGDTLRTKFLYKNVRPNRPYDIIIVDEVDNMFVEKRTHSTRLGTHSPGMIHLRTILEKIWKLLENPRAQLSESGAPLTHYNMKPIKKAILDEIKTSLKTLTADEKRALKKYQQLKIEEEEVQNMIFQHEANYDSDNDDEKEDEKSDWEKDKTRLKEIETKLKQVEWDTKKEVIQIPEHLCSYVNQMLPKWIDSALEALSLVKGAHYDVHNDRIVPVDHQHTGTLQKNTTWSHALSYFLAKKENTLTEDETIVTNFTSTLNELKQYKRIYGLSGTLGGSSTKEFLKNTYEVNCLSLPPHALQPIHNNGASLFLSKEFPAIICKSKEEHIETIITTCLQQVRLGRAALIICPYINDVNKVVEELKKVHPTRYIYDYTGQKTFSHNRLSAQDIIVATNIAGRGTDFKTNDEIEQNGGLHVCISFLPINDRVDKQNTGRTGRCAQKGSCQFIFTGDPEQSISQIRSKRTQAQKERMKEGAKNVQYIGFKDKLFERFCKDRKTLFPPESDQNKGKEAFLRKAVDERWGLFLISIEDDIEKVDHSILENKYDLFIQKVRQDVCRKKAAKNPYYEILEGNQQRKNYDDTKAIHHYKNSIQLDPSFSLYAHYYLAYIFCKENKPKKAKEQLEKAKIILKTHYLDSIRRLQAYNPSIQESDQTVLAYQYENLILSLLNNEIRRMVMILEKVIEEEKEIRIVSYASVQERVENYLKQSEEEVENRGLLNSKIRAANLHGFTHLFFLQPINPVPTGAVCFLVGMSVLQIGGGMLAICSSGGTFAPAGKVALQEGISDLLQAYTVLQTREFDRTAWMTQKAISCTVSAACMGLQSLAEAKKAGQGMNAAKKTLENLEKGKKSVDTIEKTAKTVKIVSKLSICGKHLALGLAQGVARNVFSTALNSNLVRGNIVEVIQNIIKYFIEPTILQGLKQNAYIKNALATDEYHQITVRELCKDPAPLQDREHINKIRKLEHRWQNKLNNQAAHAMKEGRCNKIFDTILGAATNVSSQGKFFCSDKDQKTSFIEYAALAIDKDNNSLGYSLRYIMEGIRFGKILVECSAYSTSFLKLLDEQIDLRLKNKITQEYAKVDHEKVHAHREAQANDPSHNEKNLVEKLATNYASSISQRLAQKIFSQLIAHYASFGFNELLGRAMSSWYRQLEQDTQLFYQQQKIRERIGPLAKNEMLDDIIKSGRLVIQVENGEEFYKVVQEDGTITIEKKPENAYMVFLREDSTERDKFYADRKEAFISQYDQGISQYSTKEEVRNYLRERKKTIKVNMQEDPIANRAGRSDRVLAEIEMEVIQSKLNAISSQEAIFSGVNSFFGKALSYSKGILRTGLSTFTRRDGQQFYADTKSLQKASIKLEEQQSQIINQIKEGSLQQVPTLKINYLLQELQAVRSTANHDINDQRAGYMTAATFMFSSIIRSPRTLMGIARGSITTASSTSLTSLDTLGPSSLLMVLKNPTAIRNRLCELYEDIIEQNEWAFRNPAQLQEIHDQSYCKIKELRPLVGIEDTPPPASIAELAQQSWETARHHIPDSISGLCALSIKAGKTLTIPHRVLSNTFFKAGKDPSLLVDPKKLVETLGNTIAEDEIIKGICETRAYKAASPILESAFKGISSVACKVAMEVKKNPSLLQDKNNFRELMQNTLQEDPDFKKLGEVYKDTVTICKGVERAVQQYMNEQLDDFYNPGRSRFRARMNKEQQMVESLALRTFNPKKFAEQRKQTEMFIAKGVGYLAAEVVMWYAGDFMIRGAIKAVTLTAEAVEIVRAARAAETIAQEAHVVEEVIHAVGTTERAAQEMHAGQTLLSMEQKAHTAESIGRGARTAETAMHEANTLQQVASIERRAHTFETAVEGANTASKAAQEGKTARQFVALEQEAQKGANGVNTVEKISQEVKGGSNAKKLGGEWIKTNESMSLNSAKFQSKITGKPSNWSYELNGVKFDGLKDGILLEVKGKHRQFLTKDCSAFKSFFEKTGQKSFLKQARRQIKAAEGTPIQWVFQEKEVAEVVKGLFVEEGLPIKVIF